MRKAGWLLCGLPGRPSQQWLLRFLFLIYLTLLWECWTKTFTALGKVSRKDLEAQAWTCMCGWEREGGAGKRPPFLVPHLESLEGSSGHLGKCWKALDTPYPSSKESPSGGGRAPHCNVSWCCWNGPQAWSLSTGQLPRLGKAPETEYSWAVTISPSRAPTFAQTRPEPPPSQTEQEG